MLQDLSGRGISNCATRHFFAVLFKSYGKILINAWSPKDQGDDRV